MCLQMNGQMSNEERCPRGKAGTSITIPVLVHVHFHEVQPPTKYPRKADRDYAVKKVCRFILKVLHDTILPLPLLALWLDRPSATFLASAATLSFVILCCYLAPKLSTWRARHRPHCPNLVIIDVLQWLNLEDEERTRGV